MGARNQLSASIYKIHTLYKEAEDELRRMRYADLSDSISQIFARDMFFFCIYCRGISFTDLAHIRKKRHQWFHAYLYLTSAHPTHRHGAMGRSHASNSKLLSIDHRLSVSYYLI